MELVVHGSGAARLVEANETDTIAVLKEKVVLSGWPAEREIVSVTVHDSEVELPDGSTLLELEIRAGMRLVAHTCRAVRVEVTYNHKTVHREFHGAATVKTVTLWALSQFGIEASELPCFELQYGNPATTAIDDTPLADLPLTHCSIAFNLVPSSYHKG